MISLDDDALARLRKAAFEPDLSGTRYRLLGIAGQGGMATVYVALDTDLGRRVALKVIELDDPELTDRLRQEAAVLAQLEHPGIVPVHEVGQLPDGRVFYAMKLVDGDRLDQRAPGLAEPERLRIFLRIAETVAFAHAHGVLHRDLKPENVMIGSFGEVLVLDWGLAKILAKPVAGSVAQTRRPEVTGRMGTPGFMSPEQAAGEAVDQRSDVFSLGRLLQSLLPEVPAPPLRAIVAKATAAEPEGRYPDVVSLARDVANDLDGEAISAFREGLLGWAVRSARRHRAALGILLAYVLGRGLIALFTHR